MSAAVDLERLALMKKTDARAADDARFPPTFCIVDGDRAWVCATSVTALIARRVDRPLHEQKIAGANNEEFVLTMLRADAAVDDTIKLRRIEDIASFRAWLGPAEFELSGVCRKCDGTNEIDAPCAKCNGTGLCTCTCECGDEHQAECEDCDGSTKQVCNSCLDGFVMPAPREAQLLYTTTEWLGVDRRLIARSFEALGVEAGACDVLIGEYARDPIIFAAADWRAVVMPRTGVGSDAPSSWSLASPGGPK